MKKRKTKKKDECTSYRFELAVICTGMFKGKRVLLGVYPELPRRQKIT